MQTQPTTLSARSLSNAKQGQKDSIIFSYFIPVRSKMLKTPFNPYLYTVYARRYPVVPRLTLPIRHSSLAYQSPIHYPRGSFHAAVSDLCILAPNFHTSSSTSLLRPVGVDSSEKMTRSASAPASNVPLTPWRLIMAAGVAVTALSASGMPVPDHSRKLLTHSRRVMELFHLVSHRVAPTRIVAVFPFTDLPAIVSEFSSSS